MPSELDGGSGGGSFPIALLGTRKEGHVFGEAALAIALPLVLILGSSCGSTGGAAKADGTNGAAVGASCPESPCPAGQVCVQRTAGGKLLSGACVDNPCGAQALDCSCAKALCATTALCRTSRESVLCGTR
jgi:hypothetical protein